MYLLSLLINFWVKVAYYISFLNSFYKYIKVNVFNIDNNKKCFLSTKAAY